MALTAALFNRKGLQKVLPMIASIPFVKMPSHKLKNPRQVKTGEIRIFQLLLISIVLVAFFVRVINISFASLWSDELYSMLSVHPQNSVYEMLYMQRRDQPPLFFVVFRWWTTLFGFNDLSARSFSLFVGTLSVYAIGLVNKVVFNERVGLLSALIVAFNFSQIEHSLEVRFYGMLFLLVTISIYTYYLTTVKKSSAYSILHAGICASVILTHYFGFMVVLAYGIFDLFRLWKNFTWSKIGAIVVIYGLTALFILPWFIWSYESILSVKQHISKTVYPWRFLHYNLRYQPVILWVVLLIAATGMALNRRLSNKFTLLLALQVLLVFFIPLLYSYFFYPFMVPRYSFAMAPAIFTLVAIGLLGFLEIVSKKARVIALVFFVIALCFDGIYNSTVDRTPLLKEPWREMGEWINRQPDLMSTDVFSAGYLLKDRFTLDYYVSQRKIRNIAVDTLGISKLTRFYLVETNGHDIASQGIKRELDTNFQKEEVHFGLPVQTKGGVITIYTRNKQSPL